MLLGPATIDKTAWGAWVIFLLEVLTFCAHVKTLAHAVWLFLLCTLDPRSHKTGRAIRGSSKGLAWLYRRMVGHQRGMNSVIVGYSRGEKFINLERLSNGEKAFLIQNLKDVLDVTFKSHDRFHPSLIAQAFHESFRRAMCGRVAEREAKLAAGRRKMVHRVKGVIQKEIDNGASRMSSEDFDLSDRLHFTQEWFPNFNEDFCGRVKNITEELVTLGYSIPEVEGGLVVTDARGQEVNYQDIIFIDRANFPIDVKFDWRRRVNAEEIVSALEDVKVDLRANHPNMRVSVDVSSNEKPRSQGAHSGGGGSVGSPRKDSINSGANVEDNMRELDFKKVYSKEKKKTAEIKRSRRSHSPNRTMFGPAFVEEQNEHTRWIIEQDEIARNDISALEWLKSRVRHEMHRQRTLRAMLAAKGVDSKTGLHMIRFDPLKTATEESQRSDAVPLPINALTPSPRTLHDHGATVALARDAADLGEEATAASMLATPVALEAAPATTLAAQASSSVPLAASDGVGAPLAVGDASEPSVVSQDQTQTDNFSDWSDRHECGEEQGETAQGGDCNKNQTASTDGGGSGCGQQ
jgi:hypothetical protein